MNATDWFYLENEKQRRKSLNENKMSKEEQLEYLEEKRKYENKLFNEQVTEYLKNDKERRIFKG